jgi:putative ATPase
LLNKTQHALSYHISRTTSVVVYDLGMHQPLADLIRPTTLDAFIGQEHLVDPLKPLGLAYEMGHVFSMIFWGPPGVGKTTLGRILAQRAGKDVYELSGVSAGKADIKKIVESHQRQRTLEEDYRAPVLFLDEIHRFNKAQQDYLLPFVESGQLILIGATTENPSFEVIAALLSRTKVFVLHPLSDQHIATVIRTGANALGVRQPSQQTLEWLVRYAAGDARRVLSVLDHTHALYQKMTLQAVKNTVQSTQLRYDKTGEEHYDTISAFIKSMRASNVDAALYYLARMIEAGEDPKFIARRMVVFASEDIGLAQPTALVVANAVFAAVQTIGYPEAQINLAHGTAYLAQAKKDRSAYDAYFAAKADVRKHGNLSIPLELRNAPTKLMKELNYGKGYEMYPDAKKSLLPDKLRRKKYF